MEYRRIFDTIPEEFDRWRTRYAKELFTDLIDYTKSGPDKTVLELGPGTGQATDPILQTGCEYYAIELGDHFCRKLSEKYGQYPNYHLIHDDFMTHDFGDRKFDLIYSAATIQWIPEEIAFSKTFDLLKPGGVLAMMLTKGDYKSPNEALYQKIQQVYDAYFKPDILYPYGSFSYQHAPDYGYVDFEKREYAGKREYTADEYAAYCGTHSDHLVIPEPYKSKFFDGLRETVRQNGNKLIFWDTHVLYLAKKPERKSLLPK